MAGRALISERDVTDALRRGDSYIIVPERALVTALAREIAGDRGIELRAPSAMPAHLEERQRRPAGLSERTVVIGSDHGGFDYKRQLHDHLAAKSISLIDVGTDSAEPVDYPDFAFAVALAVASGRASIGIMIDGAGIGSAIVCNKLPGVRAACAYNEFTAWNARAHNDANVLTLGSRTLGIEVCRRIVDVFLESDFEGGRHEGRVRKIDDVEDRVLAAARP